MSCRECPSLAPFHCRIGERLMVGLVGASAALPALTDDAIAITFSADVLLSSETAGAPGVSRKPSICRSRASTSPNSLMTGFRFGLLIPHPIRVKRLQPSIFRKRAIRSRVCSITTRQIAMVRHDLPDVPSSQSTASALPPVAVQPPLSAFAQPLPCCGCAIGAAMTGRSRGCTALCIAWHERESPIKSSGPFSAPHTV